MRSTDARPDLTEIYTHFAVSLEYFGEFGIAVATALREFQVVAPTEEAIGNLLTSAYYARRDDIIHAWLPLYHKKTQKKHAIEKLMQSDAAGLDQDITTSELMLFSIGSGAFADILREEEDAAWQHLR